MAPPTEHDGVRPPDGAPLERDQVPSYDPNRTDYAGISRGTLDRLEDVRAARAFAEMIIDTVREGLLILDTDLRVVAANESFYRTFEEAPEETVGRKIYELGDGQWDIPELHTLLEDVLPDDVAFNDYEVDHTF